MTRTKLPSFLKDNRVILSLAYLAVFILFVIALLLKLDLFLWLISAGILALGLTYFTFKYRALVLTMILLIIISWVVPISKGELTVTYLHTIIILIVFFGILTLTIYDRDKTESNIKHEEDLFNEEFGKLSDDLKKKLDLYRARAHTLESYTSIEKAFVELNEHTKAEDILDVAAKKIYRIINKGTEYIFFRKSNQFKLIAGFPPNFRERIDAKTIDFNSGIYEYMQTEKRAVEIDDISKEFQFKDIQAVPGSQSLIANPLVINDKVAGFIKLDSREVARFDYNDLRVLSIMSDLISLSLTNSMYLDEITNLATKDSLTGFQVRRAFMEKLEIMLTEAKEQDLKVSLIFMDIDHFKNFNDTYGHLAGDKILSSLGRFILDELRDLDLVGRYGGEEFAVALQHTSIESAFKIAERLRTKIENLNIEFNGITHKITISQGIAEFHKDNFTLEQLIEAADKALYIAKKQGRNKTTTFDGKL